MYRVGIDIGGTSCKIGIVDEQGKVLHKGSMETNRQRHPDEIINDLGRFCAGFIADSTVSIQQIKSVGVGSPGTPDKKKGVLVYSNNVRFDNTEIREILQKYIDKDVFIDNDANCAALAEATFGACRGTRYSFTITLGTGVGSGAVLDGKLYSGFNYGAPELGHMVIALNGKKCTCGRRGCWEQYSSATALIEDTKEAIISNRDTKMLGIAENDLTKVNAKTAFDGMRLGDGTAARVVETYITRLAQGLANVINIFQPEVIALGGGVSNEGTILLDMLGPLVFNEIYTKPLKNNCRLVLAVMGNDAGIIGAALLDE